MTNIKFDQGDINHLTLKQIHNLHKEAKKINHTLILRGYIKCDKCGNSVPLDMYIKDSLIVCDCYKEEKSE